MKKKTKKRMPRKKKMDALLPLYVDQNIIDATRTSTSFVGFMQAVYGFYLILDVPRIEWGYLEQIPSFAESADKKIGQWLHRIADLFYEEPSE